MSFFKDKTLLSTRIGLTHLNTDDPEFLFKWNGYIASIGITPIGRSSFLLIVEDTYPLPFLKLPLSAIFQFSK